MKKVYVFFSGATDVTGNALKDGLKAAGGTSLPKEKVDVLISWGAKTSEDIALTKGLIALNHPNNIRINRNKYEALKLMKNSNVSVGRFVEAGVVATHIKNNTIKLPLVGRTKFHQGGKNFWLCLTKGHVADAVKQGAQYFQEYMPIAEEYRMHVFKDEVFYTSIKTQSKDPQKSFVDGHSEKIVAAAAKSGTKLDTKTLEYALGKIAERNQHSNPILKSHTEAWNFKAVGKEDLKTATMVALAKAAIAAVKALNLDFGAVDCGVTEDGEAVIIEVNTGPGLEGTSLTKWLEKFSTFIKSLEEAAPVKKAETLKAVEVTVDKPSKNKKEDAIRKAELLKELLMSAKDEETDSIMSAASRMFSSEAKAAAKVWG